MSYDDDERSVSQSRPIDLYTITTPTKTYRVTSHPIDVTYGGQTFAATTMSRGNQQITQDPTGRELMIYLPISHPLVQRWAASGIPEHGVTVLLQRMQAVSGIAVQQWSGFITSMGIDGHTAMFQVPSVMDDALKIKLPVIRAQRLCNHVLYDTGCTLDRAGFAINPPSVYITAQSGTSLTVSTIAGSSDQRFQFGEAVHSSLQSRMILSQIGTTLTLNAPFVGAVNGDGMTLYSGCAHDVRTCRDKFGNVVNFGGFPDMDPTFAPWLPGQGLSSVQQP